MSDSLPFLSDENTIDFIETTQNSSINISKISLKDINDNEQFYNDILDKLIYSNGNYAFFICKKCKKQPLLKFEKDFLYNLDEFKYTCDCQKNEYTKITIEEFEKLFGVGYFEENNDYLQDCFKCDKKHKFSGFLEVDKKDSSIFIIITLK